MSFVVMPFPRTLNCNYSSFSSRNRKCDGDRPEANQDVELERVIIIDVECFGEFRTEAKSVRYFEKITAENNITREAGQNMEDCTERFGFRIGGY